MKDFLRGHGGSPREGFAQNRIGSLEQLEPRDLLAANCLEERVVHDEYGEFFFEPVESSAWAVEVQDGYLEPPDPGETLYELAKLPLLHSNPTASQKIFLDFDGQSVNRTGWNEYNSGKAISAPAFTLDSDPNTFSPAELEMIERIWTRVAEDFAPFDLDVTTEAPSPRLLSRGSQAIRVLISSNIDAQTGKQWFSRSGGVAYLHSWQWPSDTPVWVFANNLGGGEQRIAEAASHELGHSFGLRHDGTSEQEYFRGYGTQHDGWAPIMGSGYSKAVTQWSRGEYGGANNHQNDLDVIASSANQIGFAKDIHSQFFELATQISNVDNAAVKVTGAISKPTDIDVFRFKTSGGRLEFELLGAAVGSNLDIHATLFDDTRAVIGTFNPPDSLSATVHAELTPGQYYLRIDGVGRGDPTHDGYSDYGSVGRYTIQGGVTSTEHNAADPGDDTPIRRPRPALTLARLVSRMNDQATIEEKQEVFQLILRWIALYYARG